VVGTRRTALAALLALAAGLAMTVLAAPAGADEKCKDKAEDTDKGGARPPKVVGGVEVDSNGDGKIAWVRLSWRDVLGVDAARFRRREPLRKVASSRQRRHPRACQPERSPLRAAGLFEAAGLLR